MCMYPVRSAGGKPKGWQAFQPPCLWLPTLPAGAVRAEGSAGQRGLWFGRPLRQSPDESCLDPWALGPHFLARAPQSWTPQAASRLQKHHRQQQDTLFSSKK